MNSLVHRKPKRSHPQWYRRRRPSQRQPPLPTCSATTTTTTISSARLRRWWLLLVFWPSSQGLDAQSRFPAGLYSAAVTWVAATYGLYVGTRNTCVYQNTCLYYPNPVCCVISVGVKGAPLYVCTLGPETPVCTKNTCLYQKHLFVPETPVCIILIQYVVLSVLVVHGSPVLAV